MRRTRLVGLTFGFSFAIASCGEDTVGQSTLSGGGSDTGASGGMQGDDRGEGDTIADDTGDGSGDAGHGGDADAPGDDDTGGGIDGPVCAGTQMELCEEPGIIVHCYSGASDTCDVGQCHGGTQTCQKFDLDLGQWSACEGEVLPELEVCDGLDNDCDGDVDEDFGQTQCGLGECNHVQADCVDGAEQTCDPLLGASDEACDGLDNDCDGDIDEDFAGQTMACGQGVCAHAVAACVAGMVPTCDPFANASAEICDGLDNDCDGQIDDGLGSVSCGIGVCEHVQDLCVAGVPQVCNPWQGVAAEICDGLDNDCDGQTDEGFGVVSCGQGVCQHQLQQCVGGQLQLCNPLLGAGPEVCFDGLDNDCDGQVDEDCVCGDGIVVMGEQCDGANLNGQSCFSQGYSGGVLGCNANCTFNPSGCWSCGDGTINPPGEQCDGAALGSQTCLGLGYAGGTLSCNPSCMFNTSGCWFCGNAVINPGEACDGLALGGQSCLGLGYSGGTLGCLGNCTLNTSGCWSCGDGVLNPGEACDGNALGGQTCAGLGFGGGTLACTASCTFDTSGCNPCGNGTVQAGEQCDGAALNGQSCASLGHGGGMLSCNPNCTFNETNCFDCGDGTINVGEQCDGAAPGGLTCQSFGFNAGTLGCTASCTIDTSGCFNNNCGNGVINPPEQCDGLAFGGADCEDYGFAYGNLSCNPNCTIDTSGCTNQCDAPVAHIVCDGAGGNQFRALGLNCPGGDATNSTHTIATQWNSPAGNAWRVATQYGTSNLWTPREGNAFLIATTGVLPALNAQGAVVFAASTTQPGTPNANPGSAGPGANNNPVNLPPPIVPIDGSNNGLGGTPYLNCNGVGDCSDTLDSTWQFGGSGAYDLMWWQLQVVVPGGTSAYAFDIAWFDSEYPEWIGSVFTDVFVVWSESEAYTGNVMINNGESFSSNSAAPFVNYQPDSPALAGTGYAGVGGATGWYTVTGPTVPSEAIRLTFALFETGDDTYDGTVLVDNFRWDCDGCIMGVDCLMVPAP